VLVTYFLTKRLFGKSKFSEVTALVASGVLAVSPWHIMLSRAAFEANVATFFLVCGVWLFLGGVQEKKWYLPLSIASFVFSVYTFNTARIVAPILVLVLSLGFIKILLNRKKQLIFAFIVGVLLILPVLTFLFSPQASLRFKEVNIFTDIDVVKTSNQEIINDSSKWSRIIHNRRVGYALSFVKHYFDNLNPGFLFITGDGNPKFSTQEVGEMYIWELPFLVVGTLFLFKRKEGSWWIIPLWAVLGIIPAATARETPHALRIETIIPTFQILIALGIVQFLFWFNKLQLGKRIKPAIIVIIFSLLILNIVYFLHDYYVHYAKEFSGEWQYGYKDSITYAQSVEEKYNNIYITSAMGRPYIYYLFYTKTDPRTFRNEASVRRDSFGFVTVDKFGKYNFINDVTKIDNNRGIKNLFIQTPQNVPSKVKILNKFYLLNGSVTLVAYD
jgi:4-amino-4-deoxy-L-arabinose transferase-like glycosyltransferase